VSTAQIEAEYLNKYEVRDNALYLRIKLGVSIPQPPPPSRFIVVPKPPMMYTSIGAILLEHSVAQLVRAVFTAVKSIG
jgi:hypothetical protein